MSFLRRRPTLHLTSPVPKKAVRPYDRLSQLPRLIGLWPSEMQDYSAAGTAKILALLRKALRLERSRGRSGHWAYDLNRHLSLAESVKAERVHLRELDRTPVAPQRIATSADRGGRRKSCICLQQLPKAGTVAALNISPQLTRRSQPVSYCRSSVESSS